ncbi:MtrAB system histidine kinase MtrB [Isoptericola cucumis]|uniref:Sensor histidine kinase MtrB n=1 Tax=Isoptericola cucumis TaxID=1776856 RepID=A0ABQ2B8Q5_9MICO|nr:MtrAB system histidine kinase MtrB [Isoptericola cucumis]GGI08732.1 two-component sensor histidine kinase [Isoptericola cucumis]
MPPADSAVRSVRRALRRWRDALSTTARSLARRWRSSLQLRVVTSALALGVVALALLGVYLSFSIRDGLFEQRVDRIEQENVAMTEQVRTTFQSSPATTTADLQTLLSTMIQTLSAGASSAQDFLLLSAPDLPVRSLDVATEPGLNDVVSPQLRAATVSSSGQVLQSVRLPAEYTGSGVAEPGVVVGSTVEVPTIGTYELYAIYSLQAEQETLAFVQRTLAVGAVAILALVGVLTWVVTLQTVAPVRRAATVAARLADGHLDERMAGSRGHDEMATLARTFNEMAANLEDQIARMEELSAAQRRFVSDVSHELRTPLTTIRMAGDVIHASREDLDPAAERSAELLVTQLDRFESLLTDLLEISRFDAGAAVLDVEPRDLRDLVSVVVETAAPLAASKGVFLSVSLPEEPATADVDPRRVERVVRNLVVNALEHAEGKPVEVTVATDPKAVAVVVRDHGIGLTPQQLQRVFDRFWRADPARTRTTGGTGLGLAISVEDAHLHAGWLEAWGKPGEGASFRLTLPRRAGIRLERSPVPLTGPSRGVTSLPTGQIPVVNPPTGPTPTAIPELAAGDAADTPGTPGDAGTVEADGPADAVDPVDGAVHEEGTR